MWRALPRANHTRGLPVLVVQRREIERDTGVVQKQLALLEGLGGDHAALYGLLTRRAVGLAERRAKPPAAIGTIAQTVEESLNRSLNQAAAGASVK